MSLRRLRTGAEPRRIDSRLRGYDDRGEADTGVASATLVLRKGEGDTELALGETGAYVIVPRGTWHIARISGRANMLFITPGESTENREQPD